MKKFPFLLTIILSIVCLSSSSCSSSNAVLLDANGKAISNDCTAYINIALDEAQHILEEKYSSSSAQRKLKSGQFQIETYFDFDLYTAMQNAATAETFSKTEIGCAVTDLGGHLLATFSSDDKQDFSTKKTMPFSSFKPLSVYAPAIEAGLINWSTMYQDAPYKTIHAEDGTQKDWPSNSDGTYSNKPISIQTAVASSINTVAVRVLSDYGVENSIDFLMDDFSIDLEYEKKKIESSNEQEVIGNIALGYIQGGVSPIDMAGYYQIFANGGAYMKPCAVRQITDKNGAVIYQHYSEPKQIFSFETSCIMNHLLQTVVSPTGTGAEAMLESTPVAGKTGTGELGNWFVGVTPKYSLAVWHGKQQTANVADVLFADIMSAVDHQPGEKFPLANNIKMNSYCAESGLLANNLCKEKGIGYYNCLNQEKYCLIHNSFKKGETS